MNDETRYIQEDHSGDLSIEQGEHSGDLSTFFPGVDKDREKAATDASFQAIDYDATMKRDEVAAEESEIPTYKNPLIKTLAVVGSISVLVIGGAVLWLKSSETPAPVAVKTEAPKEAFEDPTVGESQLKGQLALDKQNEMLKGSKLPAPEATPVPTATKPLVKPLEKTPTPAVAVKPATPPAAYKPTPPIKPVTPPTPTFTPVARPFPIARAIPIPPYPKPIVRADPKRIYPVAAPKPLPLVKPFVAFSKPTPIALIPPRSWQEQSREGTFGGSIASQPTSGQQKNVTAAPPQSTSPYLASESEAYGLPGEPRKTLHVGAKSIGILLTPIQIASSDTGEQLATIGLNQPLVDRNGKVVIPAGAQIEFKVTALDNGWLKATSTKILVDGRETQAVAAFTLTAERGEPLIAQLLKFGEDAIAQQDRKNFILGALQNVGAVLTQPNTQTTISSGTGGINSTSSSTANPNILGAVLKGGFDPLAQQQLTRSTQEIQRLLNSSKLWYLPTGTNVRITSAQTLSI